MSNIQCILPEPPTDSPAVRVIEYVRPNGRRVIGWVKCGEAEAQKASQLQAAKFTFGMELLPHGVIAIFITDEIKQEEVAVYIASQAEAATKLLAGIVNTQLP